MVTRADRTQDSFIHQQLWSQMESLPRCSLCNCLVASWRWINKWQIQDWVDKSKMWMMVYKSINCLPCTIGPTDIIPLINRVFWKCQFQPKSLGRSWMEPTKQKVDRAQGTDWWFHCTNCSAHTHRCNLQQFFWRKHKPKCSSRMGSKCSWSNDCWAS